ncbi:SulP family inorganic anion transporter [Rhizobium sp. PL01]|uniref:SulP family inorganic anion transporter n=1 Tax=Rhizobium sp. PL01 TaxID=3085631 RepID=UPI002982987F|nr:SulP family inorganic anion transporter [Rhizobium sp. PL01]MDW5316728.1 SulP family inorganic anion transporter [Rhizobium sp. PL01]
MRKGDWIAGLSVAGLMLPEAVAYAGIAGLPPQRAICAAIAGCLAYGLLGRSRFAIVSPTSSSAAILAATLLTLPGSADDKAMLATILVALVGVLFLAASMARLGNLAGFISRPVLRGFAFGLAITIVLRQIPVLAGVAVNSSNILHLVTGLVSSIPQWHLPSILVGAAALAALIGLRRVPLLPGAFLVLCAGIAVSTIFDLSDHGVALVGAIPLLPAWPDFSSRQWREIIALLPFVLPLVLILFAESWGTIRSFSLRHNETVEANRELGALGLANLASAVVQGMPVGAGFSAGAASEAAGAQSRATAVVAALGLALLIAFASGPVALLPQPVLAAVVIAALTHALDPMPLLRLWRLKRDGYIALGAALGVLVFGVLDGMLVAIVLSLAALLKRMASPYVARLGRLAGGHDFVDIARHADAVPVSGIAVWRPAQPLFFANADAVLNTIASRIRADSNNSCVVVSLEESFDLDSTALDALLEFDTTVRASGKRVQYARVHDRARDLIETAAPEIAGRCSVSVDDAVSAVLSQASSTGGAS